MVLIPLYKCSLAEKKLFIHCNALKLTPYRTSEANKTSWFICTIKSLADIYDRCNCNVLVIKAL